MPGSSDSF